MALPDSQEFDMIDALAGRRVSTLNTVSLATFTLRPFPSTSNFSCSAVRTSQVVCRPHLRLFPFLSANASKFIDAFKQTSLPWLFHILFLVADEKETKAPGFDQFSMKDTRI